MTSPIRNVSMSNHTYNLSPHRTSFFPSGSPSEPGPSSVQDQRRASSGRNYPFQQPAPQQHGHHGHPQATSFLMDNVRLTKDGVPRKKPGRKPGTGTRKSGDDITPMTSPGSFPIVVSDVEGPKQKRVRKPKDPDAPPVPRKRRAQPSSATGDEMGLSRSSSAHMHFEPKAEFTSMRMDFDPRPAAHPLGPSAILSSVTQAQLHPRKQPPPADNPPAKRESHQSSVMSILNADDSPPRPPQPPASTTPVRSVGQSYDPIRSSYDPVRETMFSRDPYGTGPMGSPRAPPQLASRTSASPSIASLVNPAPVHHNRSPDALFATAYTQASPPVMTIAAATTSSNGAYSSRYRDSHVSLPPSPSPAPALRATSSSTTNPAPPPPPPPPSSILKSAATYSKPSPQVTATSRTTSPAIPPLALAKSAATKASIPARSSKASTKAETKTDSKTTKADAKDEADGPRKTNNKPPPGPPVPASAKSAAAKPPTKAAEKKAAAAAAKAAAADAKAAAAATKAATKAAASEASNAMATDEPTAKLSGPTTTSFKDVAVSATSSAAAAAAAASAPHIKKFSSILHQERGGKQSKSAASSPKLSAAKGDGQPSSHMSLDSSPQAEPERSILDFGKALPGEENAAPSIVLHIPLVKGETNKYVNFMRMAEERYGWDALHPRLAAHRDRKLRIAAASAALERNGSGRESGDEMTDDMQSGDEGSNEENGAAADNAAAAGVGASGPGDAPAAKPARKKRIFKEDEYDKDDDFVDDSEMMWEEQAATSRDGFFVYSGPLVPEEEKPAEGTSTPVKRGRGSRGGRGGSARGGARTTTARGAGGPGSRGGGAPRKPRATKQEKEARDREKAELKEASAKAAAAKAAAAKEAASQPFSSDMAIDDF